MFTPKASSKQKWVKKKQERETGDAVTVQRSRGDRQPYGNEPVFTPKTPISSTLTPNLIGNITYDYSTA